jgi:hypothetical protein
LYDKNTYGILLPTRQCVQLGSLLLRQPRPWQLASVLTTKTGSAVISHCLGLSTLEGVPSAVENMIVVNFDTGNWVADHNMLTEIGVSTFDSRDMRALNEVGMHGENLLKQVYFYHARILENAHLRNIKYCVGDPDE